MGRIVIALLLAVMVGLTGYVLYTSNGMPCCDSAAAVSSPSKSCCSESATASDEVDATPACCKDKANCCQTKGEAGACCQNPSKADAIAGDTKPEKKD